MRAQDYDRTLACPNCATQLRARFGDACPRCGTALVLPPQVHPQANDGRRDHGPDPRRQAGGV